MSTPKQITLIAKYLTNTIKDQEEKTLNEWLTASKEHVDIYLEYLNAWEKAREETPKLKHSFIETLTFLEGYEKSTASTNLENTKLTPENEKMLENLEIKLPELIPSTPTPQPKAASSNVVKNAPASKPKRKSNNKFLVGIIGVVLIMVALGFYFIDSIGWEDDVVTITSGDKVKEIKLPDNTIVTLNKHSSISYKLSAVHDIKLNGEAYFDVMESENPFTIECDGAKITAEGETFNIRSYSQDDLVEVAIEQGKATLEAANIVGNNVLKGQSGYKLAFKKENQIMQTLQNDNPTLLAWKEGKLDFKGQSLASVFETLERYYEVKIKMKNNDIGTCNYAHNFGDSDLMKIDELLNVIAKEKKLKIELTDGVYQISGRGCGKRIVNDY